MYDVNYLDDAMTLLADMCEYIAVDLKMDIDDFWELFLASGYARECEVGNCVFIAGKSGIELAKDVFKETGYEIDQTAPGSYGERSAYYWAGWILAYYQWKKGYSFRDINEKISMKRLVEMYRINHELSEERVVDNLDLIMNDSEYDSKIAFYRRIMGYSQRTLSNRSGVNIRTLQQYEIGAKDVNKASAGILSALARELKCNIEDLI